ncbi:MAG: hypothetical protein KKD38_08450, partial [Candidatus Delongbacteria bacterium]|nr:hypothetical protein [Candidatus Delongbacteria bacterium]
MTKLSLEQNNTLESLPYHNNIKDLIVLYETEILSQDEFNVALIKEKANYEKTNQEIDTNNYNSQSSYLFDKNQPGNEKEKAKEYTGLLLENNKSNYIEKRNNSSPFAMLTNDYEGSNLLYKKIYS